MHGKNQRGSRQADLQRCNKRNISREKKGQAFGGNYFVSSQHGVVIEIYDIDVDEILGFSLLRKNHIFTARVNISFLSFTCEDIGVIMVISTISQLTRENISFLSFTCEDIGVIMVISTISQ